jgi:hypothetical protein
MFDGWFTFAGNEVINNPRFNAYVEQTLPHLTVHTDCASGCTCEHLASFVGDKPYATPMIDDAPWVDVNRQESFGFLGIRSLGVTGLMDDSRTADIVPALGDGGWITGRRREPKEVRFSVLLAAKTEESMHYGEQWLKSVLDGECADGCTPTAQLCFLTDCIDPETFAGVVRRAEHSLAEWRTKDSSWQSNSLVMHSTESWGKLAVTGSCGSVEWELKIRGEAGVKFVLEHDGFADVHTFDGSLQTFYVATSDAEVTIRPLDDLSGYATWSEPSSTAEYPNEDVATHFDTLPRQGVSVQSRWSQVSTMPVVMQIAQVITFARYELTDDECANEFYRYLRRVACIDGPRVRRTATPHGGGVLKWVEFTIASEVPYLFGAPIIAASGPSTNIVEQVTPFKVVRLAGNIEECDRVEPGPLLDPLQAIQPPPPAAATSINDTFRNSQIKAAQNRPHALVIPADTVPQWANVVPIVSITAATDVRFVRVRFLPMPFESLAPTDLDPCSACGSFEIAYIPAGATFVIDGTDMTGSAEIGGTSRDANHLLTSLTGTGTPSWPTLTCGVGYLCVIDTRDQSLSSVKIELVARE